MKKKPEENNNINIGFAFAVRLFVLNVVIFGCLKRTTT